MTQERASKLPDPLQPIRHQVADAVGGLMELWGFKRIMGRTWALLYLAEAPVSAAELGEALHVSPGSVSMTVGELLKWGVVKKTWVPGDRRDFYLPETSVWKMVSRVIRERELVHVRETNDQLAAAQKSLHELTRDGSSGAAPTGNQAASSAAPVLGSAPDRGAAADAGSLAALPLLLSRIAALQQLGQIGQQLLEQVLGGRTIDVVGLHTALNLVVAPLGGRVDTDGGPASHQKSPDDDQSGQE